ncbi:MAG: SCO family protein [Candidatus Kapaibacteriales bacterium]
MAKLIIILIFLINITHATTQRPEVGIVEKLGNKIPLDLVFTNSEGKKVQLGQLITKPTILMFVYYHCPGICSPLLTSVSETVDKLDLLPGKDYQLITISFDHKETYDKAKKWKNNHLKALERAINPNGWEFLVGDSASVYKLTDAIGFYFKPDTNGEFLHGAAVYAISKDGEISRYLFGTEFSPFDFKMAIIDAESGFVLPTVNRILKFCYSYDPSGRKYMFDITRIVGTLMLFSLAIFLLVLLKKKRKNINGEQNG